MNKQQTAVEWYAGKVHDLEVAKDFGAISVTEYYQELTKAVQQAKEMEKEQIKSSWNHGFDWGMMEQSLAEQGEQSTLIDADYYYNETYGGGRQ
jgi:Zn-dependent peptidase ImmA (M78 family)